MQSIRCFATIHYNLYNQLQKLKIIPKLLFLVLSLFVNNAAMATSQCSCDPTQNRIGLIAITA